MFKVQIPVTKFKKSDDGLTLSISGVASGPMIDRDTEKMSKKALSQIEKSVNVSEIPIRAEHKDAFYTDIGVWKSATMDTEGLIHVDGEVDLGFSLGSDLARMLEKGKEIGLSIGGTVNEVSYEFNKELGVNVRVYEDISLSEISIVKNPAYPEAEVSLSKSVDWDTSEVVQSGLIPSKEGIKVFNKTKAMKKLDFDKTEKACVGEDTNVKKQATQDTGEVVEATEPKAEEVSKETETVNNVSVKKAFAEVSELIAKGSVLELATYFDAIDGFEGMDKRLVKDRAVYSLFSLMKNRTSCTPKQFEVAFDSIVKSFVTLNASTEEVTKAFEDRVGISVSLEEFAEFERAYNTKYGIDKSYTGESLDKASEAYEKLVFGGFEKSIVSAENKPAEFSEQFLSKIKKSLEEKFVNKDLEKGYTDIEVRQYFYDVEEAQMVLQAIQETYKENSEEVALENLEEYLAWLEVEITLVTDNIKTLNSMTKEETANNETPVVEKETTEEAPKVEDKAPEAKEEAEVTKNADESVKDSDDKEKEDVAEVAKSETQDESETTPQVEEESKKEEVVVEKEEEKKEEEEVAKSFSKAMKEEIEKNYVHKSELGQFVKNSDFQKLVGTLSELTKSVEDISEIAKSVEAQKSDVVALNDFAKSTAGLLQKMSREITRRRSSAVFTPIEKSFEGEAKEEEGVQKSADERLSDAIGVYQKEGKTFAQAYALAKADLFE